MCVFGFNPQYIIQPCFKRIGVTREAFETVFTGKIESNRRKKREKGRENPVFLSCPVLTHQDNGRNEIER
jgi:hypothetical protein